MALIDQLKKDLEQSLKSGEALRVETLRGLLSAIHNREIELRGGGTELDEEEMINVLSREAKKRKEASQIYSQAGRTDLADKEIKELEIVKTYLPPEMSPSQIEEIARLAVESGASGFGQVMQAVMKEVKGRAEAGTVKEIVERILANGGK